MRCWFSGRMPAFQAGDKSSILLRRTHTYKNNKGWLLVAGIYCIYMKWWNTNIPTFLMLQESKRWQQTTVNKSNHSITATK